MAEADVISKPSELWPIGRLVFYENNPRKHSSAKVEQFAAAIKEFGFRVPVLAKSDGTVVDGHFRLKAAQALGLEKVPVVTCDDMTEEEIRRFRLSVNRMAELAEWDQDGLLKELETIEQEGFKLHEDGPVGFGLEDIDPDLSLDGWDFTPTKDTFVVTVTGSLPLEAQVRERLKGLEGVNIEASVLQKE